MQITEVNNTREFCFIFLQTFSLGERSRVLKSDDFPNNSPDTGSQAVMLKNNIGVVRGGHQTLKKSQSRNYPYAFDHTFCRLIGWLTFLYTVKTFFMSKIKALPWFEKRSDVLRWMQLSTADQICIGRFHLSCKGEELWGLKVSMYIHRFNLENK